MIKKIFVLSLLVISVQSMAQKIIDKAIVKTQTEIVFPENPGSPGGGPGGPGEGDRVMRLAS